MMTRLRSLSCEAISRVCPKSIRPYYVLRYRFWIYMSLGESGMMVQRLLGLYESSKAQRLRRIAPGKTFVDVGANKGYFSLLAARQGAQVISFEPLPGNVDALRRSVARNGFPVTVHPIAIADKPHVATLYLGAKSGWNTISSGQPGRDRGTIEVEVDCLDNRVESFDVLKIDVEGAEDRVLAGATRLLRQSRGTILMDLHPHLGADLRAVWSLLSQLGYSVYTAEGALLSQPPAVPCGVIALPRPARA